ncbi:1-aminocyclopropane-1-carboxylate oxidase homolog isoform X1 [Gossypium arboreum]|uniref:Non-haem dioxygenase N-terminal domain-containing protein n=1 Tax=Gossypium arboreum TaxID=29729 RepID=A0ABR0QPU1_GOSAR|nr:1-aminocyclopropane-1-carboxylate oxidase homolog isoform X1 [Gossypium arboreum]KAK5840877.1 hypothetical protein PVK06_009782 [Gossypium arboreum]
MVVTSGAEVHDDSNNYDKEKELKAFDNSKAGVKGLVGAGITKVPRMFIRSDISSNTLETTKKTQYNIPVIDLQGIEDDPRRHKEISDQVRHASETWGFFQIVNHGIPVSVLEDHIGGLQVLHEDKWIDVPCSPGALVINMLISNDAFVSVEHRVLANSVGPRVSVSELRTPDCTVLSRNCYQKRIHQNTGKPQ